MPSVSALAVNTTYLRPGMRLGVAVSGGADSVALLRSLLARREALGLVLSVVHVHHGIARGLNGAEADVDAEFVRSLAQRWELPLHFHQVDAPRAALERGETLEEAARNLRFEFFGKLLASGDVDAIGTAHTLDDQAETVVQKLLRGAWTEGIGAIHPVLNQPAGLIVRPMLEVRRVEVEAYLKSLDQPWREDSSNTDTAYTRNRVRHELLPLLRGFNPRIDANLAHLATLARDEEAYWRGELGRLLPSLVLPGKPVRGGGRATSTHPGEESVAIEIERLRPLHPALRRRVLRAVVEGLGHSLSFEHTQALLALCGLAPGADGQDRRVAPKRAGARLEISAELTAERTARELRLLRVAARDGQAEASVSLESHALPVPGTTELKDLGLGIEVRCPVSQPNALLRGCRPGDRVTLRHSRGPKRVKEVLERLHLSAAERACWPLIEWQGEVIWLRGVDVQSETADKAQLEIVVNELKM